MDEIEDIKDLLSGMVLKTISKVDVISECACCGREVSVKTFIFRENGGAPSETTSLKFCFTCRGKLGIPHDEDSSDSLESLVSLDEPVFDEPVWAELVGDGSDLIKKIGITDPAFMKALSGYMAQMVSMEDGTEHPLLQSIADGLTEKQKIPTEKQRNAFKSVYSNLLKKKRAGEVLRVETDDEKTKRKRTSQKLVGIAMRNLSKFSGGKTRTIITSMNDQFISKGCLSAKQLEYLRYIVEQLPAKDLSEFEKDTEMDTEIY